MKKEIGTLVTDSAGVSSKAIYANKVTDKYGRMLYGNHYYLKKGTYDIVFRMKTDAVDLSQVVADIGLEGMTSGQVGAYKEIRGTDFGTNNTYKDITITVKIDYSSDDVVPYIYMNGQANLWVTTVIIKTSTSSLSYNLPVGYKSLPWEAENLSHSVGSVVTDSVASGGKNITAIMSADNYGLMTFGPYYDKLSPGVHVARFRLKTDDYLNTKYIGKLEVYNSDTNSMVPTLQITGWDFNVQNAYQDFDVPYIYTGTGKIEYRTWFYDSGTLAIDKVTDMGLFTDVTPPTSTGFTFSDISNQLTVSFGVSKNLSQVPTLTLLGAGVSKTLGFSSVVDNIYNYSYSGTDNLSDGIYSVVANNLIDLLGNQASNVNLGTVTIKHVDLTPPNIANITFSPNSINSGDNVDIYFQVDKPLKDNPIVTVGNNPAFLVSTPDQDIAHRYHYVYTVIDSSTISTVVTRAITVQATDMSGNTGMNSSTNITLNLTNIGTIYESENLPASTGKIIDDSVASSGKARKAIAGVDQTGAYLQFGPYSSTPILGIPYIARFRIKSSLADGITPIAVIDVVSSDGSTKRVSEQIRGIDFSTADTYQDFNLPFMSSTGGVMEYRVQFLGVADVTVDKVTIVPATVGDTISFESEDLYGVIGNVVADTNASAGKAVLAQAGKDAAGTLQFGPYTTSLTNGTAYIASFRLKTSANTSIQPIALVDVYDEQTGYREYKELRAVDFPEAGVYESFDIPFVKPNSSNIEFRVFFYGVQDLWADKVDISKQTTQILPEYESENLPIVHGKVVLDPAASGNMAVQAKNGEESAGTVQFGPYDATNLVNGKYYKANFRMKTQDNTISDYVALVDVYAGSTGFRKTLQIKGTDFNADNQYQDFSINFEKPIDVNDLEYRVIFSGVGNITVDNVQLAYGVADGLPVYESEKLPNPVGKIVVDSSASDGKAVFFDKNVFPAGWMQFGPYHMDGVQIGQNYKAAFRLKVADNTVSDPVAIINVYNAKKGLDDRITLRGTDFAAANQYQEFTMPFTVLDTDYMEFKVYATGNANISADKVTITQ